VRRVKGDAVVAVAFGGAVAIFGLAAANGYAWEMVWLPAVILAAAWGPKSGVDIGCCVRRLRR